MRVLWQMIKKDGPRTVRPHTDKAINLMVQQIHLAFLPHEQGQGTIVGELNDAERSCDLVYCTCDFFLWLFVIALSRSEIAFVQVRAEPVAGDLPR